MGLRLAPRLIKPLLPGMVRVSFGIENGEGDVDPLVTSLKKIAAEPVRLIDRLLARTHNATPLVPDTEIRRRMRASADRDVENVFGKRPENVGIVTRSYSLKPGRPLLGSETLSGAAPSARR